MGNGGNYHRLSLAVNEPELDDGHKWNQKPSFMCKSHHLFELCVHALQRMKLYWMRLMSEDLMRRRQLIEGMAKMAKYAHYRVSMGTLLSRADYHTTIWMD
eukprot:421528_1